MSNFAKKVLSGLPADRMNLLRIEQSTVHSGLGLSSAITGSIKELFYDYENLEFFNQFQFQRDNVVKPRLFWIFNLTICN